MNAVTAFVPSEQVNKLHEAHLFVGRLVAALSDVEIWTTVWAADASCDQPLGLGLKLKQARQLAEKRKRPEVIALLEALRPYAELRGLVCHSSLNRPGTDCFRFKPAHPGDGAMRWRPVTLSLTEMQEIIEAVRSIGKTLCKTEL